MCNRFLPSKKHGPHRLCIACRGKSCKSDNWCEKCHDWSGDRCSCVSDYVEKLSLQRERKKERKTMSSFSSFPGFSPSMPVPLGQLPSFAGSGVVTTSPSASTVCAVTFSVAGPVVAATPFVPPSDVTSVEPSRKRCHVEDLRERERMLAEFEDFWASGKSFSLQPGLSSASQPLLVTPPVVVPAPVPSVVPVAVEAASAAALSDLSHSAALSGRSYAQSHSRRSPGPRPAPTQFPSVPAPASGGSRSWSCHPYSTWSRS